MYTYKYTYWRNTLCTTGHGRRMVGYDAGPRTPSPGCAPSINSIADMHRGGSQILVPILSCQESYAPGQGAFHPMHPAHCTARTLPRRGFETPPPVIPSAARNLRRFKYGLRCPLPVILNAVKNLEILTW